MLKTPSFVVELIKDHPGAFLPSLLTVLAITLQEARPENATGVKQKTITVTSCLVEPRYCRVCENTMSIPLVLLQ